MSFQIPRLSLALPDRGGAGRRGRPPEYRIPVALDRELDPRVGGERGQALHYLKTNREDSIAIIARYARFMKSDVIGPAYDSARRLYNDTPMPMIEGLDFTAKELAQRNPKLRELDVGSVVDLRFVRELEQRAISRA